MSPSSRSGTRARIYTVVSRIPKGRVASYGQIARLAGLAGQARLVGYALAALPAGSGIPWQRVVNAKGEISPRKEGKGGPAAGFQRARLEGEGIRFDDAGRIRLDIFRWRPRQVSSASGLRLRRRSSDALR
jgi:methylated-DNA-protein-cysteine methyltransferase-like protein